MDPGLVRLAQLVNYYLVVLRVDWWKMPVLLIMAYTLFERNRLMDHNLFDSYPDPLPAVKQKCNDPVLGRLIGTSSDLRQGMTNSQMEPWNNLWADLSQGMANSQMEPSNNLWADLSQGMLSTLTSNTEGNLIIQSSKHFFPPGTGYVGCYAQEQLVRAHFGKVTTSSSSMTPEMCVRNCKAEGFPYAAVFKGNK